MGLKGEGRRKALSEGPTLQYHPTVDLITWRDCL